MIFNLPENVINVLNRLNRNGYPAYAVGGCVRDAVLGAVPKDYDIATAALPEQVRECFPDCPVIDTGVKHGTVTVVMGGENIEVTTFRKDGGYSDHRRPDSVSFDADLHDDLARRDLTVNAMAYSPDSGLIDPFGGQRDLFLRKISCVGDPEKRFDEDALRILRALRFASELDFEIDTPTAEALHKMKSLLAEIAPERVNKELTLLLCGKAPFKVLTEFTDVFAVIVPEIAPSVGFEQHSRYHIYDVWIHSAAAVERSEPDPDVRLALMLHDLGKPQCFKMDDEGHGHFPGHEKSGAEIAAGVLRRLRFPGDTAKRVEKLIRYHYVTPVDDVKVIKRLLAAVGEEDFFPLLEVMKGDNRAKQSVCLERVQTLENMGRTARRLLAEKACLRVTDLAVNGVDMQELGYSGGEIGGMLKKLLDAVIDEKIPNKREKLLEFAKKS